MLNGSLEVVCLWEPRYVLKDDADGALSVEPLENASLHTMPRESRWTCDAHLNLSRTQPSPITRVLLPQLDINLNPLDGSEESIKECNKFWWALRNQIFDHLVGQSVDSFHVQFVKKGRLFDNAFLSLGPKFELALTYSSSEESFGVAASMRSIIIVHKKGDTMNHFKSVSVMSQLRELFQEPRVNLEGWLLVNVPYHWPQIYHIEVSIDVWHG